jgi:hypothetical protein
VCVAGLAALSGAACGRDHGPVLDLSQQGSSSSTGSSGSSSASQGSQSQNNDGFGDAGLTLDDGSPGTGPTTPQCTQGGACIHACQSAKGTTISGKVYDPAGRNPLYDIAVYVPSQAVDPLTSGASCASCESLYSGGPIASALTDATGSFTIDNAPDGTNVPLVVQIGKWRNQFVLPTVMPCVDNPQADGSLHLPKNHTEGDIPNIAIATGGADTLECLLERIGLDAAEYEPGATGPGRIHIYHGATWPGGSPAPDTATAAPAPETALWDSDTDLMPYDVVLLSCEGVETVGLNSQNLFDYANAGGRVFASHLHYAWFTDPAGPFVGENLATWTTGTQDIGNINGVILTTYNGLAFPKGQAMHDWLGNVGALTNNELPIQQARHNADVATTNVPSVPWIVADPQAPAPGATQYFSFDTPVGADAGSQCGRVVFSDLHVGAASGDYGGGGGFVCPGGCAGNPLSPQEKALEFMLFDLSACLTPPNVPPQKPPVR